MAGRLRFVSIYLAAHVLPLWNHHGKIRRAGHAESRLAGR
jgi:hypothetical protein